MAVLQVRTYPDKVLTQKAKPIAKVDKHICRLAEDMAETMYAAPGIGLAANQVGELQRLIVVDVSRREGEGDLIVIVNPEIIAAEGEVCFEEGCLSVPEYQAEVKRHQRVVVQGLDIRGKPLELDADGLLAIVLQHEIDHLDGVLFIDRLSRLKRDLCKRRLRKLAAKQAE